MLHLTEGEYSLILGFAFYVGLSQYSRQVKMLTQTQKAIRLN
jgi:hypothetical protein